ncbi:MAG: leucine-rich repeat domain-containing protein [Caldilineaceae bacterium SB0662_bin_9]|uniref:Leucine-rich repeat domain-containing protein n=1 Tax=Caldilineaceae bacterium SB0662_bin_9 TaxID=2605258 RepID=A0A6B1DQD0_9CHLR|nr:leucine-rich repeat domain-containing protein [Caldilineaceae bacterium SB0662_bin_9]
MGLRRPTDKVFALLQHAPQLTRLTLDGLAESLPADSLAHLSHLTHLTVEGGFNPCEAPALQLPATLTDFALRLVVEGFQVACLDDSLADNWLTHAPALTRLSIDLHGLANLETDVLPSLPALTHLTLDVSGMTALPPRLLADLPHLTHLQLHGWPIADLGLLPAEFLASNPQLIELSLELPRLNHIPAELLASVPNLRRLYLSASHLETLPAGLMANASQLTDVHVELYGLETLPDDFLSHTPQLRSLYLGTNMYKYSEPALRYLPERFLSHTPKLTHLWLALWALEVLPSSFLTHAPLLQHLELDYIDGYPGRRVYPLRSFPDHFLENAPNLTYLNLWPVVHVSDLPMDFLARSSLLRHLYLDANGVSVVPDSFLTQTPHLQSLELDLRQVDALPDAFLAHTPWLRHLKLNVDQVDAIPDGFLTQAPHLEDLYMRAANVTALPEGFLGHGPRIETLGLGMPHLESPPRPGDALWDTLQSTSFRVKVIGSDAEAILDDSQSETAMLCSSFEELESGEILEVFRREQDSEDNTLLGVARWWTRDLFFSFYERRDCWFKIDVRYTEPTLDV